MLTQIRRCRGGEAVGLAVARDDQLLERPAIAPIVFAGERRVAPFVPPAPRLPRPLVLGFFLVTVVVSERRERLQVLLRTVKCALHLVLALEGPAADAKKRAEQSSVRNLQLHIGIVRCQAADAAPVSFQMREERDTLFDGNVLT